MATAKKTRTKAARTTKRTARPKAPRATAAATPRPAATEMTQARAATGDVISGGAVAG